MIISNINNIIPIKNNTFVSSILSEQSLSIIQESFISDIFQKIIDALKNLFRKIKEILHKIFKGDDKSSSSSSSSSSTSSSSSSSSSNSRNNNIKSENKLLKKYEFTYNGRLWKGYTSIHMDIIHTLRKSMAARMSMVVSLDNMLRQIHNALRDPKKLMI